MGGGAWPFLVGGVICLVNSVNERDLNLLNSYGNIAIQSKFKDCGATRKCGVVVLGLVGFITGFNFLEGLFVSNEWKFEAITGL